MTTASNGADSIAAIERPVVHERPRAAALQRLDQPGPPATSTRSPGSTSSAAAIADETTEPVGVHADRGERRFLGRDRRRRVVGDEQDPPAAAWSAAIASGDPSIG